MTKQALLMTLSAMLLLVFISACATPEPLPTVEPTTVEPVAAEATEPPTATPMPETKEPTPTSEPEAVEPTSEPVAPPTATPSAAETVWSVDGVVGEGEYTQQADFEQIQLWWGNDEENLYLLMEGDTQGWVSIGINPERGMQGANYIFGYVENGEAKLWDAYGTAPTGANHPPDDELGGTDDIVSFMGIEENGTTRFEFQIPLDSGDAYDQALKPGETYPIIVAIGRQDEYNGYHQMYDQGELTLVTP